MYGAIGFMVVVVLMFALGLKRGARMQGTNARIEENQRRALALSERSVVAQERIAEALERRNG